MRSLSWLVLLGVGCSEGASTVVVDDATAEVLADAASDGSGPDAASDGVPSEVAGDADGGRCGCTDYTDPVAVGTLPAVSKETSGLAASRKNPGVLYAHNDSGDTARIFALDEKGALLGQLGFGGVTAVDWEDIAVGPCAEGSCVFVSDAGDNAKARSDYALYVVPEPSLDGKPFATQTLAPRRIPFSYPDGKWNCETLLVHPTTGRVYLVTKDDKIDGGVYAFPEKLEPGVAVTVEKVGSAAGTKGSLVTGGDVSPCGDRVLLRTYGSLLEYTLGPGLTVGDALATKPRVVPVATEAQGEAVAFRLDGRGYFTASEGSLATLSLTGCR